MVHRMFMRNLEINYLPLELPEIFRQPLYKGYVGDRHQGRSPSITTYDIKQDLLQIIIRHPRH